MKVPNLESAKVPPEKIEGYLLSFMHPTGRSKAEFFSRFGFSADSWKVLADALLRHVAAHEVGKVKDSAFGTKYIVDGPLDAPDGRRPVIRAVWFVERGESTPRFVTAHPV